LTATYEPQSVSTLPPRGRARTVRRALGSVPRAAWLCALIAFLNATAWALTTPAMLVPDEPAHVYYVQQLAETGQVPKAEGSDAISPQNEAIRVYSHLDDIVFGPTGRPAWTPEEAQAMEQLVHGSSPKGGGGSAGVGLYPPLYYATLVVPYAVTNAVGGSLIEGQFAMRIVSALYAAGAVLFVFLFLRELIPRAPWAWRVGALACALQPLFGFISGGVSPDSLLTLFCAAVFYLLARAFRRGLTPRLGALLGLTLALATLAKLAALGLLPGAVVAGALLVWRAGPDRRRAALAGVGTAVLAFAAPIVIYLVVSDVVWHRPLLWGGGASGGGAVGGGGGGAGGGGAASAFGSASARWSSLSGYLSYTWQLVFPRLGFMHDWLPGFLPNEVWFRGWIGRFGWGGLVFDDSVYTAALVVFGGVVALIVASLVRLRRSVARRVPEFVAYFAMVASLICFYGYVGYHYFLDTSGAHFEQARYLFPLLALYGATPAVAVAGLGRRWGVAIGATLVVLAFAHDVAALVLNVGHYYA
jgi:4-amino-4-deoxy-L-arabinose transferase-like glycosyltransferase